MNKVTKVTAAIAACAGMFAFTACGSSSAETGGDVELNIWGGVQADQGFNKVIEGFEEANPGIKVNYTRFTNDPTGNTKLDTALIADDSIDMFFTYSPVDFAKRAGSGIPLDLSEVDEDGLLDKVEDANIKYDGKYYGIPTSNESYNIVYNKTAFEKLGITIPANWTWDEFMEIARKATHEENGKTVYGLAGVWHNIERQIYGGDAEYTKDGESPNFSDKGWIIKQKYYDMLFKDKSAYPFTQIMAKKIYNYESQLLLTGDALMAFYSPWMSRSALNNAEQYPRDFKMGFAPLPKIDIPGVDSGEYNAEANNWLQISSKSKHTKEAYKFIKYVLTDGAEDYTKMGKLPMLDGQVSDEAIVNAVLSDYADKLYDVDEFKKVVVDVDSNYIITSKFKARASLGTIETEGEQSYYLQSKDYDQYIDGMTESFNAALAKE